MNKELNKAHRKLKRTLRKNEGFKHGEYFIDCLIHGAENIDRNHRKYQTKKANF